MKASAMVAALLWAGLVPGQVWGQQQTSPPKPVIRDTASHEELANRLRQSQSGDSFEAERRPDPATDPTKANPPVNLLDRSDIISYNGLTTLVPKRAILAVPQNLKSRVGQHHAGHRVVPWKEFFQANRGWINTVEVSRAQAEGKEKFSDSDAESIARATRLIIATYQTGPISVLPLKEPDEHEDQTGEPAP